MAYWIKALDPESEGYLVQTPLGAQPGLGPYLVIKLLVTYGLKLVSKVSKSEAAPWKWPKVGCGAAKKQIKK